MRSLVQERIATGVLPDMEDDMELKQHDGCCAIVAQHMPEVSHEACSESDKECACRYDMATVVELSNELVEHYTNMRDDMMDTIARIVL